MKLQVISRLILLMFSLSFQQDKSKFCNHPVIGISAVHKPGYHDTYLIT